MAKAFHDHIWSNDAPRSLFRLRRLFAGVPPASAERASSRGESRRQEERKKVSEPMCHKARPR